MNNKFRAYLTKGLLNKKAGSPTVSVEMTYQHPRSAVWKALTDRNELAEWLFPNDFKPEIGHKFTLRPDGSLKRHNPPIKCEVIALEEEKLLAYSWQIADDDSSSVVLWTLESLDAGTTRVRLEHTWETETELAAMSCVPIVLYGYYILDWERILCRLLADILNQDALNRSFITGVSSYQMAV